jgi:putative nucleotidyltransferase with HDIG domain
MSEVFAGSEEAVGEAEAMVEEMVEIFLSKAEVLMHLMDQPQGKEGLPYHVLNVTVLALSLGREAGLGEAQLQDLGLAALFHDIGKMRIEKKLLKKKPPLSQGELEILQAHPRHGVEIAARTKRFSHEALKGIWQHHERRDGSGYPKGLRGADIGVPARIIRIVDLFDNFCNRIDPRDSLPPNWALNRMYTRYEDILDHSLLSAFIKRIGIFPPGTVVRLSNESLGMVVSVNPNHVLRPYLLLYDPEIPKKEAIIFSLEDEPQLTITGTLHPGELSEEVHRYLSPRPRVSYYMEPSEGGP